MFTRSHCSLLFVVSLMFLLTACGTSTPAPTSTATPTEPPTATLVPPTATSVPTNTPVSPTKTPQPTATSRPTETPAPTATPLLTNTPKPAPTKVVTPKPTNTKGVTAPVSTGGGVSSTPSTLATSIEQSFNTAQSIRGVLDQISRGGGVELCAPLIEKYQSLHNAPTYDMTGQSNEMQQAYALYRQAIDLLTTRGATIQGCGQGGGAIGGMELGLTQQTVSKAVEQFGQSWDLIKFVSGGSSSTPLGSAILRLQYAAQSIMGMFDLLLRYPESPGSIQANDSFCVRIVALGNGIQPFEMDTTGQPPSTQTAYQLYREAIDLYQLDISNLPKMCASGEGRMSAASMADMRPKLGKIIDKLTAAQNALK